MEAHKMTKQRQRYFLFFVIFIMALLSVNAYAINSKAIRNTSEGVLYGSDKLSKIILAEMLKEIAKPETNPRIFLTRGQLEAKKVIQTSISSIEEKLKKPDSYEFINMSTRVTCFLEILKTEFTEEERNQTAIELSFLLEAVDEQF